MTRELEAVEEGERRFHSVDPGFTWTDIHTSQLPFLHSWVVWVAGPLLGARFFGFQIVATEFKGIQEMGIITGGGMILSLIPHHKIDLVIVPGKMNDNMEIYGNM